MIGAAVVKNGNSTVNLYVENNVPLLREKDILGEAEATTVCKRILLPFSLCMSTATTLPFIGRPMKS